MELCLALLISQITNHTDAMMHVIINQVISDSLEKNSLAALIAFSVAKRSLVINSKYRDMA